jgi:proteasome activator-like protein
MTDQHRPEPDQDDAEREGVPVTVTSDGERVVVVTPDGMGVSDHEDRPADEGRERPTNPADLVEQPAKVMRIGSMVKQLLDEVRSAPLDEKGRARLAEIHSRSIRELEDGLAPELVEELERITLPFSDESPSDAELRIAQAQLVGWLEGLFHGIQTALVAQQMAAQAQLQQMRQLPPGTGHPGMPSPGGPGMPRPAGPPGQPGHAEGTGQYL